MSNFTNATAGPSMPPPANPRNTHPRPFDSSASFAPAQFDSASNAWLRTKRFCVTSSRLRDVLNVLVGHKLLRIGNGKHRIEHTDISLWSLGVVPFSLRVRVRDFDFARLVVGQPSKPQESKRTGTIPFMALDLLTDAYWNGNLERLYRHDLESFVWVVVYNAWVFDDEGLEDMDSPVRKWLTADYEQCHIAKADFLMSGTRQLPGYQTRKSADSPLSYTLSIALRISSWLLTECAQRQKAAYPQIDALDPFARKNHLSRSSGDELEDAKRDFDSFWVDIEHIRDIVKNMEPTPERVKYVKSREKEIEELKAQRKMVEEKLDREADAGGKGTEEG